MKVLIAGDYCPQDRVATLFEKSEFGSVLGGVKSLTHRVDYSIVNFECPVCKGGEKPISKIGPNLRCSFKGVEALKWAGFDCVTLANNHFLDFGREGVLNTTESCKEYGLDIVGGGLNIHDASAILYKKIEGEILAIINCCEHEFSIATESSAGCNPLNPIQQYYSIKEARKKANIVLVIVHGGHEHFQLPSPRMQETYRFFIDAGADAVVNHHQHCFSGYEEYHGKPIFYGLGNLCFDNPNKRNGGWTEGYAVSIDFSSREPVFSLCPYKQCTEDVKVQLLPVDSFDRIIDKLNSIINEHDELLAEVEKYYTATVQQTSNLFEPIYNRYYFGAKRRGWLPSLISRKRKLLLANFIICEAHYDKVKWFLKK